MKPTHIVLKPEDTHKLTDNFRADEFTCKCGNCHASFVSVDLLENLQSLREELNEPITVTSGYRCPQHNKAIGGASKSQHVLGNAVDLYTKDLDKLYKLCEEHFEAVGDGRLKGFVHVDERRSRKRRWTY